MKRVIVGIAFTAMLALMLTAGGTTAYAASRGNSGQPSQTGGTAPAPQPGGSLFEALGVTWE